MDKKLLRKYLLSLGAIMVALWLSLLVGGYSADMAHYNEKTLSSDLFATPSLVQGSALTQTFLSDEKNVYSLALHIASGSLVNMQYSLEQNGAVLANGILQEAVSAGDWVSLLQGPVGIQANETLQLRVTALENNDVTLFYSNVVNLSRGSVPIGDLTADNSLLLNGQPLDGKLNVKTVEFTPYNVSLILWGALAVSCVLFLLLYAYEMRAFQAGKATFFIRGVNAAHHYSYMLLQLISRSFKSKYKRSVFGILRSFLNPLLTMLIQYIVFSTLFQSNIAYFPVYLLSGTICFSYFNEATSTGLTSISGNASLITKVYIPKYIFPLSYVLSSGINFALTLIPLLAAVLISGLHITLAYFLLPVIFLCMLMLCTGVVMLLSCVMVYFRDIQFIWNVMCALLMYATPLFYPETIIPAQYSLVLDLNPLYHIIRLFRYVLISGVPEPRAVLVCFVMNFLILLFGSLIFKRYQDTFVLNL